MAKILLSVPEHLASELIVLHPDIAVIKPAEALAADKVWMPYPDEPSPISTTRRKYDQLVKDLGFPTFEYLCQRLINYSEDEPKKFAKYKDHAAVLRRWHEMKVGDGYVFSEKHGQYIRRWVAREDGVL